LPPVLPSWFPSERALTTTLVFILVITTTAFSIEREPPRQIAPPAGGYTATEPATSQPPATEDFRLPFVAPPDDAASQPDSAAEGVPPNAGGDLAIVEQNDTPIDTPPAVASGAPTSEATSTTVATTSDSVMSTETPAASDSIVAETEQPGAIVPDENGYLLPHYRIVAYYGQPHDPNMGILGQYPIEELYAKLMEQVAAWEAADPSRPVIPAFEIIATVAQQQPMSDGTYLLDTDWDTIQKYIDFAADHDMLIFLDVQVGRRGVQAEVERLLPLLEHPHVNLAIDPEFAMDEGEQPGVNIGQVDASEITWVQNTLADFSVEHGIPPKILVIHQFHYTMITNKDQLAPVPGVQLVIHADGHGPPEMKQTTYDVMVTQHVIEFAGFKIFYPQPDWAPDTPLMQPEDVLQLAPVPDIVTYQ
jgi:hypothetical protein